MVTAALAATSCLSAAAVISASPASALTWHCKTSERSVDTANYSGPWADQYDYTVKQCAARSGSYVYAKASIRWDGPMWANSYTNVWDGAYYKLMIKKSVSGTDPVLKSKKYYGIESAMEHADSYGNGHYNTGTISYRIGSAKGVSDGTLYLDWRDCCGGYKPFTFSASPRV
jgi:hypothetical protein